MEIIIIRKKLINMSIISTSLTVPAQPSPRFHAEAWLPFRNCEMYCSIIHTETYAIIHIHKFWTGSGIRCSHEFSTCCFKLLLRTVMLCHSHSSFYQKSKFHYSNLCFLFYQCKKESDFLKLRECLRNGLVLIEI